ncbi:MAG: hypothetical protein CMM02_14220 [Rhodopirellula sp.]|nr:hypothetical protein [Rhodopirellula sp.]
MPAFATREQVEDEGATFVLHPVTLDPFLIPKDAIVLDQGEKVPIKFDMFEYLAVRGELSAERCAMSASSQGYTLRPSDVICVRLRNREGYEKSCTWANRIAIYGRDVSKIGAGMWFTEIDVHKSSTDPSQTFARFLLLWSPGKAHGSFLSRLEDRRRKPDTFIEHAIDEMPPDHRYHPALPGLQLGPDDFDNALCVDPKMLHHNEQLFLAYIKPQQTMFPRRFVGDNAWVDENTNMIDRMQQQSRDRRLLGLNSTQQSLMENSGAIDVQGTVDFFFRPQLDALNCNDLDSKVSVDLPPFLKTFKQFDLLEQQLQRAPTEPPQRVLMNLPNDLLSRVFGHCIVSALHVDVDTAKKTYGVLNQVSKSVSCFTVRFYGAQLYRVMNDALAFAINNPDSFRFGFCAIPSTKTPKVVGQNLRRIGLTLRAATELAIVPLVPMPAYLQEPDGWANIPVPEDEAPSIKEYIKQRGIIEQTFGGPICKLAACRPQDVRALGASVEQRRAVSAIRESNWQQHGGFCQNDTNSSFDHQLGLSAEEDDRQAREVMFQIAGIA